MAVQTRPEILGYYILENKETIRNAAKVFNISKSTVHVDVSKRLKDINLELYKSVRKILEINFKERNVRGGRATQLKYLNLKKKKEII